MFGRPEVPGLLHRASLGRGDQTVSIWSLWLFYSILFTHISIYHFHKSVLWINVCEKGDYKDSILSSHSSGSIPLTRSICQVLNLLYEECILEILVPCFKRVYWAASQWLLGWMNTHKVK